MYSTVSIIDVYALQLIDWRKKNLNWSITSVVIWILFFKKKILFIARIWETPFHQHNKMKFFEMNLVDARCSYNITYTRNNVRRSKSISEPIENQICVELKYNKKRANWLDWKWKFELEYCTSLVACRRFVILHIMPR